MATDRASKVEAVAPSLECATTAGHGRGKPIQEEGGSLAIVVLGASGDLAKKKTFPALFALFKQVNCCSKGCGKINAAGCFHKFSRTLQEHLLLELHVVNMSGIAIELTFRQQIS